MMKRDTLDNRDLTIIMALIILCFATLAVVVWVVDRRLDALEDIVLPEPSSRTRPQWRRMDADKSSEATAKGRLTDKESKNVDM